jgi:lipopolysaccharide biosynthesis regulator YciM
MPPFLTCIILSAFISVTSWAQSFSQESLKTHLRFNLFTPKDQIFIKKNGSRVLIETLNLKLYEELSAEISKQSYAPEYIRAIAYTHEQYPEKPATIVLDLKDESIELFTFYRDADKKHILDFWINADSKSKIPEVKTETAAVAKEIKKKKFEDVSKKITLFKPEAKSSTLEITKVDEKELSPVNPEYRDFRYGASFVWDYPALIPPLEKDIRLDSKIPESFYPIKDREYLEDPKEAHVQLSINFYRQNKFGLMNKSLKLYESKYGNDKNWSTIQYLKANSLFKTNLKDKNKGINQSAINILHDLLEYPTDYELNRALYRYMLQYYVEQKDWMKSLQLAKKFFVESRAQFDQDMVIYSSDIILQTLAMLKQVDKIKEFLDDKKLMAILPPQIGFAYYSFVELTLNNTSQLIRGYEKIEKSLVKPVHPSIIFNVAEAYFREGEYTKSLKLFDEFLSDYAYVGMAPYARVRMAFVYELLDKPMKETLALYRNAMDRSALPEARYEAKVRYAAIRLSRKIKLTDDDKESVVFLEQSPDEKKALSKELKNILWLVRLRTLINQEEYDKALAYLITIPVDSLKPSEKKVYEGDGAEIIFGLINQSYMQENYTKAVKMWEVYKTKYEAQVAKNPYMNFVVSECYLKLGLMASFERSFGILKTLKEDVIRNYPIWVARTKKINVAQMISEMELIQLISNKNWDEAWAKMGLATVSNRDSVNFSFYEGMLLYHRKQYEDTVREFEKIMIRQNPDNQLTPRQISDLLITYVESLYRLKDQTRFKTMTKALLQDIDRVKSASILNVVERIKYLLIEISTDEAKPDYEDLEKMCRDFRMKFQKSPYISRINYLLGVSLVKRDKLDEGKEVLNNLLNDEKAPGYIKEMCRAELVTIELKSKKL